MDFRFRDGRAHAQPLLKPQAKLLRKAIDEVLAPLAGVPVPQQERAATVVQILEDFLAELRPKGEPDPAQMELPLGKDSKKGT